MSVRVRYQWTADLREALAHCVRKREKLWKKCPVVSHDLELRARLWAEVAEELADKFGVHIDTDDMKKTWKNLKDNYWRLTRLYQHDPTRPRKWRFYQCMRFMDRANIDESSPFGVDCQERPSSSNSYQRRSAHRSDEDDLDLQLSSADGSGQEDSDVGTVGGSCAYVQRDPLLVQIAIPEIDRLIKTKQKPATGAEIYCVPQDDVEDALQHALKKLWSQRDIMQESNRMEVKRTVDHEPLVEPVIRPGSILMDEVPEPTPPQNIQSKRPENRPRTITDDRPYSRYHLDMRQWRSSLRFDQLVQIASRDYALNDEERNTVITCGSKLRGIYHQAAFALFVQKNMPQGELQGLLDAYDDHVYNRKPISPVIEKVVSTCDLKQQSAFSALFKILQKHEGSVVLRCPDDRWARIDSEARKNIDKMFEERKKCDQILSRKPRAKSDKKTSESERELSSPVPSKRKKFIAAEVQQLLHGDFKADQQRLTSARNELTRQIVKYESAVASTRALIDMVEADDQETRQELEHTLRNSLHTLKEARLERMRVDEEMTLLRKRNESMTIRRIAENAKVATPTQDEEDMQDFEQIPTTELFNTSVKVEQTK